MISFWYFTMLIVGFVIGDGEFSVEVGIEQLSFSHPDHGFVRKVGWLVVNSYGVIEIQSSSSPAIFTIDKTGVIKGFVGERVAPLGTGFQSRLTMAPGATSLKWTFEQPDSQEQYHAVPGTKKIDAKMFYQGRMALYLNIGGGVSFGDVSSLFTCIEKNKDHQIYLGKVPSQCSQVYLAKL